MKYSISWIDFEFKEKYVGKLPDPKEILEYGEVQDVSGKYSENAELDRKQAVSDWSDLYPSLKNADYERELASSMVKEDVFIVTPETKEVIENIHPNDCPNFAKAKRCGEIVMNDYGKDVSTITYQPFKLRERCHVSGFPWKSYMAMKVVHGSIHRIYVKSKQPYYPPYWTGVFVGTIRYVGRFPRVQGSYVIERLLPDPKFNPNNEDIYKDEVKRVTTLVSTKNNADTRSATYDLATDVAEGKETINMFLDISKGLPSVFRRYNKSYDEIRTKMSAKDRKRLASAIKGGRKIITKKLGVAANLWMLYRYGISPTVKSVKDIMAASKQKNVSYRTYRNGQSIPIELRDESAYKVHGVKTWDISAQRNVNGQTLINAITRAKLASDQLYQKVNMYIPNAVWEIIPLSFIVDWFVNVGDRISSTRPSYHSTSKSCITQKTTTQSSTFMLIESSAIQESVQTITHKGRTWQATSSFTATVHGRKYINSFSLDRSVGPLESGISIKTSPMNWKRSLDAWIIARQRLTRNRRK